MTDYGINQPWWTSGYRHTDYHTKQRMGGELILKLMEVAKMAKFTVVVRNNNLIKFLATWKPLLDLLQDKEEGGNQHLGFEDYIGSDYRNIVAL